MSCFNQTQFNFTCRDLQLLLQCISISKIPENLCLELNELESLLYCNDYLNSQPPQSKSFEINKLVLVNYFRNRIPSLHKEKRDEFLSDCTHPTLRNALLQLSNDYKVIRQESHNGLFVNKGCVGINDSENKDSYTFIKSLLDRITMDAETATKLFESQAKLVALFQIQGKDIRSEAKKAKSMGDEKILHDLSKHYKLYLGIEDFQYTYPNPSQLENVNVDDDKDKKENSEQTQEPQSILFELWRLCENGRHLSAATFESIDDVVGKILDPTMINCGIACGLRGNINESVEKYPSIYWDQAICIIEILSSLLFELTRKNLLPSDRRLSNTKHINISSLMQAILMTIMRFVGIVALTGKGSCGDYTNVPQLLQQHENEALVELICGLIDGYFPRVITGNFNLSGLRFFMTDIDNWTILLGKALLGCSKQYVTREMSKWFPIVHDRPRKWLNKAVEQAKKSDEYKSSTDENDDGNCNDDDKKNYFNDEMIEEIVKLKFDWQNKIAKWIVTKLIQTTDQCFSFGIYLSNYVVFDDKKEKINQWYNNNFHKYTLIL